MADGRADAVFEPPLTPVLRQWYFLMQFVASRRCSFFRHNLLHTGVTRSSFAGAQGPAAFMQGPEKKAQQ